MSTVRRVFVDRILGDRVVVQGDEHKHLSLVLRSNVGDKVVAWSGDGRDFECAIIDISKNSTVLQVLSHSQNKAEHDKDITLYLGNLKNHDRMEFAVQKCIELGVNSIVPFVSKNTVATAINIDRLSKISINAVKQCGRSRLVKIDKLINFDELLEQLPKQQEVLFAYEKSTVPIKCALQTEQVLNSRSIAVVVGSEGGFDDSEIAKLCDISVVTVSLGIRILRAETAAIGIMSLLSFGI